MFNSFTESIKNLNNSKFFAGLIMIILNIGSKYITIELSKSQEDYLRNSIGRQLLIFSIAWMGSRDIFHALVITGIFHVMTVFLFNEESRMCIIPSNYRNFNDLLDKNKDGVITKKEIEEAEKLLNRAKKQAIKREEFRMRKIYSS